MKKYLLALIALVCLSYAGFSQAPQSVPYQAVARDASGNLLVNQQICVRFTVKQGAGNTVVYQEYQGATTNKLGLFTMNLNSAASHVEQGSFTSINWNTGGAEQMQVDLDISGPCTGSNNFTTMGTSPIQSVPYALSAGNAAPNGNAGGDLTGTYPNPTLTTTGVTANTYGTNSTYPVVTVDAKGRVTNVTTDALPTTLPPSGTAGGDLTGSYPSPVLISSGVSAGTYGTSSTYPVVTVDAKGRVTNVTTNALPTTLPPSGTAGGDLTGNYPSPTLVTSGVSAGTYGSATQVAQVTVDAKGRVTLASNQNITPAGIGALSAVSVSPPLSGNGTSGSPVACANCVTTSTLSGFAAPNNKVGISAIAAGSAATAIRSDATFTIDQTIAPSWTGTHTFSNSTYSALFTGGNVGIGISTPIAALVVSNTPGSQLTLTGGTGSSGIFNTTFVTFSGTLGTSSGNLLKMANFGCTTGNQSSFGVKMLRTSAGTGWTSTAIGLEMDVDYTDAAGASLWLSYNGDVGIGVSTPSATLDVNGGIRVRGFTSAGVVQSDANGNLSVSNFGIVPIGTIVAWHGSFANTPSLPSGWVECNGQVLSDAASPYNGQTIPDLNASVSGDNSRFLRGGTTSGTMQNQDLMPHNHTATISTNGTPVGQSPSTCVTTGMSTGGSYGPCFGYVSVSATVNNSTGSETRPYNMSVIWIMRVK